MKYNKAKFWQAAKRLLKMGAVVLTFQLMINVLNYMYADGDAWYRILWHHYYEDEGRIDQVYIGSSHVYCAIDPGQLDGINHEYNFNLSTPEQRLNSSYYLLREAAQNNNLSHVYLELYYRCLTEDNFNGYIDPVCDETYYSHSWQNTDFMKASWNKLLYMFSIGGIEDSIDILFPFSRYRSHLDDWDYIKQNISKKEGEYYRTYRYRYDFEDGNGYDEMLGQGYFFTTKRFLDEQRLFEQPRSLDEDPIGEVSEKYLRKIISYCRKLDIPLTLFISPVDELQLISAEKYDNYIKQVREIAAEYNIDFYDFNLTKEEYLPIWEGKYFRDAGHLNHDGASIFTPFFYNVVSGKREENQKFFYSSYEEKLQNLAPEIYGLYYRDSKGTEERLEEVRTFYIASNREEGMEYRICITPNDGEIFVLQDWDENKAFTRTKEEHGVCVIEARMKEDSEPIQVLRINY